MKFQRIDADLTEDLKEDGAGSGGRRERPWRSLFRKALNNDKLEVRVENLKR